jgi:poly(3-hydroxybutyrate) depolymerase
MLACRLCGSFGAKVEIRSYFFSEGGRESKYAVYVPDRVSNSSTPAPLIVALHGLNNPPEFILRYTGFTRLADENGYILLAPLGYNRRGWYGHAIPPSMRNPTDPPNLSHLSEADVLSTLAVVSQQYNIDIDRVYLLGHSMGGGGVWHLAQKYPARWAALAPICPAPSLLRTASDLKGVRHIPTILVQGSADTVVRPTAARQWAKAMAEAGVAHKYIEVRGGTHSSTPRKALPQIFSFFNSKRRRLQTDLHDI